MKTLIKQIKIILTLTILFLIVSCNKSPTGPQIIEKDDGSILITRIDEDATAVKFGKKVDGENNITIIDCSKLTKNTLASVSLADYANKDLLIELTCDMKIVDKTNATNEMIWNVNEVEQNFPQFFKRKMESGKWTRVHKELFVHVGENRQITLPTGRINKENVKIYLKNFQVKITGDNLTSKNTKPVSWLDAPSLKEKLLPHFDYFGMAIPYNTNFTEPTFQKGIQHHLSSMTTENEFKPDFIFGWPIINKLEDFVAEDGKIYQMPSGIPTFAQMDKILSDAKKLNLKLRGHVLVWHNQTPDWFFYKNFSINGEKKLVSKAEMNARQEWYIKTVLQHVKTWEEKNNNDERIIFAWDVVNEAVSDSATITNPLRTNSKWYSIYQNDEFITNAFRFANKYAPKEVKLVYNDYACSSPNKNKAICKIVDSILSTPGSRIDAVGMQTHVDMNTPITGANSFETAVQNFLAKGLNVQITEMDIAHGKAVYNPLKMKAKYKDFFTMFYNNRKLTDENGNVLKNGIEGITIWGVKDEWTWLNGQASNQGNTQHPLLFQGNNFECKPCFWGVLEAMENANN